STIGIGIGSLPLITDRSDMHSPVAAMRMRTSLALGGSSSISRTEYSLGAVSTTALALIVIRMPRESLLILWFWKKMTAAGRPRCDQHGLRQETASAGSYTLDPEEGGDRTTG